MSVRLVAFACVLAVCVAFAPRAGSAAGAAHLGTEPGATLLLPYFEVALAKKPGRKAKGATTVFTVGNATASSVLTHVVIWSDLGVPVTFFDLYLTGYDVQTVDLFDVIEGRLPATATAAQDPDDSISPLGPFSLSEPPFPNCEALLPPAPLPPQSIEHLRTALTGKPSPLFGGQCFGLDHGEKKPVARGFVTIDTVAECSLLTPSLPGYFAAGGVGVATNQNALFGDFAIVDTKKKTAIGGALVALRADATDPATDGPGDYTFYAAHVGASGADNRQPLPHTWGVPYVADAKDAHLPGGTELIVWRDPKLALDPFDCGTLPPFYPLSQNQIVAFDEQEDPETPMLPPTPPLPPAFAQPFEAAAQRVAVAGEELPVSFSRGGST